MTAKYKGGTYLIIGFDRYGGKVFTRPAENQTLTGAIQEGKTLAGNDGASFAVLRVVHNSLDENARWVPKC